MKSGRIAAVVVAISVFAAPVSAAPFRDGLVVFGDSLSETGHFSSVTDGAVPGPGYADGRFTNGPAWIEHVASAFGHGSPDPPTLGGTNYAFGAAQTSADNPEVFDIDQQIAMHREHLTNRRGRPPHHDLFVLWGGANDFLRGGITDPTATAQNIAQHVEELYAAGGRNFLVGNLPRLGELPDTQGTSGLNELSTAFNTALEHELAVLEATLPEMNLFRLDAAGLFEEAWADPGSYGLTNTTDPAVPGLEPGAVEWGEPVENPDEYMFWDGIHPSARMHELLAGQALTDLEGLEPAGWYRAQGSAALIPEPGTISFAGGAALLLLFYRGGLRCRRA